MIQQPDVVTSLSHLLWVRLITTLKKEQFIHLRCCKCSEYFLNSTPVHVLCILMQMVLCVCVGGWLVGAYLVYVAMCRSPAE